MKRSGLKANKPLKRTGYLRRSGRLPAVSDKRAADRERREEVRERVFMRDRGCLARLAAWGPCYGPLTPHHVLKSGQLGPYTEDNLITLCAYHNDLIEQDAEIAADAHTRGWVLKSWEAAK